jgi:hypothetical protein
MLAIPVRGCLQSFRFGLRDSLFTRPGQHSHADWLQWAMVGIPMPTGTERVA